MKKLLTITLMLCTALCFAQTNQLSGTSGKVDFKWVHQGGMKYTALLVPIQFKNDTDTYFMQLDFGAYKTVYYRGAPHSKSFKIGSSKAFLDSLIIFDMNYDSTNHIVGTLGMDLIESTSMELNFQQTYVAFNEDLDTHAFHQFHYVMNKILLPISLGGEQKLVCYDSGSSAFDFITDQQTWEQMRDSSAQAHVFDVNSWGKGVQVHLSEANTTLNIGGSDLALGQVAYVSGMDEQKTQGMTNTGMQGMVGNTIFLNNVLFFNFKTKKFGVGG